MDQMPEYKESLRALGVDGLRGLSLEGLEQKLSIVSDGEFTRRQALDLYLGWLEERLFMRDPSHEAGIEADIAAWCSSLQSHGFAREAVIDAFFVWKTTQTVARPFSARRFRLAEIEITARFSADAFAPASKNGSVSLLGTSDDSAVGTSPGSSNKRVEFTGADADPKPKATSKYGRLSAIPRDDKDGIITKPERPKQRGSGKPGARYVCNRCHRPGLLLIPLPVPAH